MYMYHSVEISLNIFPSLRFYVKSILEHLEVQKMPFFAIMDTESAENGLNRGY